MEVINHEQEVRIRIFVERLEVEHIWVLRSLNNVGFEVRFVFLLNLFAIYYINPSLEKVSLYAHTAYLLNKCSFSNAIGATYLNVLILLFASKLFEYFINLFPFPINAVASGAF